MSTSSRAGVAWTSTSRSAPATCTTRPTRCSTSAASARCSRGGSAPGASIALDSQFSASAYWDRVRELGATYSQGTGAVGAAILAQPPSPRDRDNPLVRASFIPMAAEAQQAFTERFGVTTVSEWFGQTEFSPICMNLAWRDGGISQGSMGFPLPDVTVRIVDAWDRPVPAGTVGELIVRPSSPGHHVLRVLGPA